MTSDDVSVIWKSAFSFTMSTKGGGRTTGTEQGKGDVETREKKKKSPRLLQCETHNLCHKRGHKKCTKHTGKSRANTQVTPARLDSHTAGCP